MSVLVLIYLSDKFHSFYLFSGYSIQKFETLRTQQLRCIQHTAAPSIQKKTGGRMSVTGEHYNSGSIFGLGSPRENVLWARESVDGAASHVAKRV